MFAVKITVGVDHLRLDPQAEVHAQRVYLIDEWLKAIRKFLRIDVPITQAGMVVLAFAEPAIIHDEAFDSQACGFFGKSLLSSLIHIESGCLPRVVDDRARKNFGSMR